MQIYSDIVQGSDEWLAIRKGKMTASHAQEIASNGKGLDTYVTKIVAECFSSGGYEGFKNSHMERGTELEPVARSMYELETGHVVEEVGFIEYNEYAGCSPDGLIGEDGLVEIKCHDDVSHFKMIIGGAREIDTKYLWQIQMNLLITERAYGIYIAYNPNFTKSLLTFKIERDEEKIAQILIGLHSGEGKIKALKSISELLCQKE